MAMQWIKPPVPINNSYIIQKEKGGETIEVQQYMSGNREEDTTSINNYECSRYTIFLCCPCVLRNRIRVGTPTNTSSASTWKKLNESSPKVAYITTLPYV